MQGKAGSSGQGQKGQAAEGTCFALCVKCPWLTAFGLADLFLGTG